jgi:transcriptional regulator of acetoin/glycerol metabolism
MASVETAPALAASWQRCRNDYNLDPNGAFPPMRLTDSEIRQRFERTLDRVEFGSGAMIHMRKVVRDTGYSVLFADRLGVVVKDFCDSETAHRLRDKGLAQGSVWNESVVGTNGIGTTLVERHGTFVIGSDHYHNRLKKFVCVSTPMVDPEGDILGVLTLAGNAGIQPGEAKLLHRLVRDSAGWIETALFRNRFRSHFLIGLAQAPDINGEVFQSLLAVDDGGFVAGASESALRLLGAARADVLRQPVSELLGVPLRALEGGAGRLQRLDAQGGDAQYAYAFPNGRRSSVIVQPPAPGVRLRGPARQPAAGPGFERLAGSEPRMQRNVELARRVADADLPILLQGETGTGKEAFARAIHMHSARSERPFVAVNCAAIPESLLDSELFGYEPGTFTGGLKQGKTGKVLASSGGTLFLDEIGDMPLELQTRLLRVLSEREVTPLGAVEPVPVALSIVCATHRDLERMVAEGSFRQDLYYRIHGVRIALPPLRERSDLCELIQSLAAGHKCAAGPLSLSAEALEWLVSHPWPGNIRQLSNVMRLLALTCDDGIVGVHDLPEEIRAGRQPASPDEDGPADAVDANRDSLRNASDMAQRLRILQALHECNWAVSKAARHLGISRATLHRRMKEYELARPNV